MILESITPAVEDYLKAIYTLQQRGMVSTNALCDQLGGIKPGSVSGMIRRLAEHKLVEHLPYHGVQLTTEGERTALGLIRNHRLLETFLVQVLGYRWDEVHAEAERLEHHISPLLAERIARHLGYPISDPHGDPIPLPDGNVPTPSRLCVTDIATHTEVRIERVAIQEPARLRYLAELGLIPGASIEVVARAPFDGPITVHVGDQVQHLDHTLAQGIFVTNLTEDTR